VTAALTRFELPGGLSASEPPEARGLRRDGVRLLVARPGRIEHARFADLAEHLRPGDLVVVNDSATLPAAVDTGGRTVHFSTRLPDGTWVVELRGPGPVRDAVAGQRVPLPDGSTLTLVAGHPHGGATSERLWRATVDTDVPALMAAHGRPVSYDYVPRHWPLAAYQTVFARAVEGGSAEMPSAGRPFTTELVTELVAAGVVVAPLTLHTGVSSLEKHEPPLAEPYVVPAATARLVNVTRAAGGRVVAVGTTVTRALETVATADGTVAAGSGWTELVLSAERPARVVDGLVTGWHEPGASHLMLLESVAGPALVGAAYAAAVRERYLWHEFGDSALLLP
jgi:S-adenosylmethionine:tRNA ribosyltransferase-isomerase